MSGRIEKAAQILMRLGEIKRDMEMANQIISEQQSQLAAVTAERDALKAEVEFRRGVNTETTRQMDATYAENKRLQKERDNLKTALESLLSVAEQMDGIETLATACREARKAIKGEPASNPWRECAEELNRFSSHSNGCPRRIFLQCTCGYNKALAKLNQLKEGKPA